MNWRKTIAVHVRHGADWPEPKIHEDLVEYIERCFYVRPRYVDGTQVRRGSLVIGDNVYEVGEVCVGHVLSAEYVGDEVRLHLQGVDGSACVCKGWCGGSRFERREVVDADGKPILQGDKVYSVENDVEFVVESVSHGDGVCELRPTICDGVTVERKADKLTHDSEDTQDKINADVMLCAHDYMRKRPGASDYHEAWADSNRYSERQAMVFDLLRRQRAIDLMRGQQASCKGGR